VKVIPGQTILGAHPTLLGFVTGEKAARCGDVISIHLPRQIGNDVDIEIIDAFADILPASAAVEAAHDSAMFDAEIDDARVVGMDEDITNVALVRLLREPPVLASGFRHVLQRGQFLPMIATVLAAIERNGFDAGIDDLVNRRINGNRTDIAI
jgi:hypothetical protein